MQKESIALLLAGGQGRRLGVLTKRVAKPAVLYGGKYRIIDFTLSNCTNSGIDTVGILTQYRPLKLNAHVGIGKPWDMDRMNGGVTVLSPYLKETTGKWYSGTANAVFQNMDYIEKYNPKYIIVLSGDHVYKMDYSKMLDFHKNNNADATISVINVPFEEASRYGIMSADEKGRIYEFEEKPTNPKSTLASMGIYVFTWKVLKEFLFKDIKDPCSDNDFGKNIIPAMLADSKSMWAYRFNGYWRDVGTIQTYWESNMDLIRRVPEFNLFDPIWRIYTPNPVKPAHYMAQEARVTTSVIAEGCFIYGKVSNSILFPGVCIGENTVVNNSIIMSNSMIGEGCVIEKSIIGEGVKIGNGARIGIGEELPNKQEPDVYNNGITVIGERSVIPDNMEIGKNVVIDVETAAKDFPYGRVNSGESILRGELK